MTEYSSLRQANIIRQQEWDPEGVFSPSFRAVELAGEVGEACNVVKKLEREALGKPGSRASIDDLAQELADIIICTDLLAMSFDINLQEAIIKKFNATSKKLGLKTILVQGNL